MTEQQPMTLTDWRGNPYTVGTTIYYPRMSGRSCEIQEGVVIDIWDAVWDRDVFKWVRFNPDKPSHQDVTGRDRQTRVKVQPTGRGSRNFYRSDSRLVTDEHGEVVRDETGRAVWEKTELKPVTLMIIENVTVATCTHKAVANA
ncbi:hypothetical protein ACQEVF_59125 [Nonomuraea polychroma]|uniref:hypothetical protein n=1 Tax=Nonomuraea polychroma TaxID=46176 RepID=UPI003D94D5C4